VRQGTFEPDQNAGGSKRFRLRWQPEQLLTEDEKNYGLFVRYLIERGRLSEMHEKLGT
jgi:hypothetical protein